MIKFIIEALKMINPRLTDKDIVYTCFTGKACNVLMQKGLKNVKTLNKLLYESRPKKEGGYTNIPVDDITAYTKIYFRIQHNLIAFLLYIAYQE